MTTVAEIIRDALSAINVIDLIEAPEAEYQDIGLRVLKNYILENKSLFELTDISSSDVDILGVENNSFLVNILSAKLAKYFGQPSPISDIELTQIEDRLYNRFQKDLTMSIDIGLLPRRRYL